MRLKLNALAIGKLNPNIIKPEQLYALIVDVRSYLPAPLGLPRNPEDDIRNP
jgi:hypothetical protein